MSPEQIQMRGIDLNLLVKDFCRLFWQFKKKKSNIWEGADFQS